MPGASVPEPSGALLRTLALCDLVESTALVERLGDAAAAELIRRHDRMARLALHRHGGREIDKTDGFLALFERPIQAVAFTLDYLRELRALAASVGEPLAARCAVHVGDVVLWDNAPDDIAQGAKPLEVEGLVKPVAARLMGLARPGQVLLSGVAHSLAQRSERELGAQAEGIRWLSHGRYRFKGVPEPIAVFEVGDAATAPMRAPPSSAKAWREKAWWQRPAAIATSVAALLVAVALVGFVVVRSERALAFAERDWVVIGDLANTTGDDVFDATLDTAFRIGMEQSRFVNVVPDAQMRQALARMQRDRTTRIDREVGSEIALREQARAVIVPSIAQYGRKLRLTAELIDPNGARAVSIETADADDPGDVLPAMDRLLRAMRQSLGESMGQIQQTSQALEKVTTANLEALRAYSRAQEVLRGGDFEQAASLLAYATELDRQFATAYARSGSIYYTQQRYGEARAALEQALSIEGRLSERERLYLRAQLARFAKPRETADLWRLYGSLYPDNGVGQNNLGNIRYMFFHDYAQAQDALEQAAATRNPLRNYTLHTIGYVQLPQEKLESAEAKFRASQELSPATVYFGLSDALAARGKFADAAAYLDGATRQAPVFEIERAMRRATLAIARDDLDAAGAAIAAALPEAARLPTPNPGWRATAAAIALAAHRGDAATARGLAREHLAALVTRLESPTLTSLETPEHALYAAMWAARLGLVDEATQALAVARAHGALPDFPIRERLAALAEAELALQAGDATGVAARLATTHDGRELWESHELRARALRRAGDRDGALAESGWLVAHPGMAYAQWIDQLLGQQARALALRDARHRLAGDDVDDAPDRATPARGPRA